jgi:hypothetical protein
MEDIRRRDDVIFPAHAGLLWSKVYVRAAGAANQVNRGWGGQFLIFGFVILIDCDFDFFGIWDLGFSARPAAPAGRADSPDVTDLVRAGRSIVVAALALATWHFARTPLGSAAGESFLHLPNLVFHEAGHVLFAPFGEFMTVLGGSLLQVLVPLACATSFAVQYRNGFGAAVCTWWAGQNLIDLAPYIADARALQLTLIGGRTGAEVEGHDWEYLLTALGMLHRDIGLGRLAHFGGSLVMIAALIWAAALILRGRETDEDPVPMV